MRKKTNFINKLTYIYILNEFICKLIIIFKTNFYILKFYSGNKIN